MENSHLWYLMLKDGQHYNELKRTVEGITNTMLTRSLRELEEDGLLYRHDHQTNPPSVTYHLTDLGKSLIDTMENSSNGARSIRQKIKIKV